MILNRLKWIFGLDDWSAVELVFHEVETAGLWREAMQVIAAMGKPHPLISKGFHLKWTERGHRIRAFVGDDALVLDALRVMLPIYLGEGQTLYRGESVERWKRREIGFAWTTSEETARMFAAGLNAVGPDGGVLLKADVSPATIIASPSNHSIYLGEHEYVVDVRQLADVERVTIFPPLSGNH